MKALIIGAAGFVGGYLIDALKTAGYDVYATKLKHENIDVGVSVYNLDLTDFSEVCNLLNEIKPDMIYHLAAQSSVKLSWEKPQMTANINILGAINLFEAVSLQSPFSKVLVVGSSEEYGDIDYARAVSEKAVPQPKNIYALTKLTQEKLAEIYVKAYNLHIVTTRSFNHIGPRQSSQFVVADFCNQVACIEKGKRKPVITVGNLDSYRDFSDVRDVVRAYIVLSEKGNAGEVYNVGRGEAIQIKEILNIILSMTESKIEICVDTAKFRPIDVPSIKADISKIGKLGWTPEISVKKSISDTLNYFRGL